MSYGMDWKIDSEHRCEICGALHWQAGLTWGIVHGQCFCNVCDAPYTMLADEKEYRRLTTPRLCMKQAFIEPAKRHWKEARKGLDRLEMKDWIRLGVPESEFKQEAEE